VSGVWRTANWHEREAYDLVGIRFRGHPDPRRIIHARGLRRAPPAEGFPAGAVSPGNRERTVTRRCTIPRTGARRRIRLAPETVTINMGPSHPSNPRRAPALVVELDGEVVRKVTPHVGYLHRGMEKIAEKHDLPPVHPLHRPPRTTSRPCPNNVPSSWP